MNVFKFIGNLLDRADKVMEHTSIALVECSKALEDTGRMASNATSAMLKEQRVENAKALKKLRNK